MSEQTVEEWDSNVARLEQMREQEIKAKLAADAKPVKPAAQEESEDFEESEDNVGAEELEAANTILKDTIVLLEYVSNPNLVKNITERERKIMNQHIGRLYARCEEIEAYLAELEDDEEE